jgi:L-ascorbate metabolism protein UlaG (beta-lactamase superfamily)
MALLAEIHGVEACICPVGDRFTMGGRVAALAMTRFVKAQVAIPCHYGTFPLIDANADAFVEGLKGSGIEALVPKKGEAFTI